MAKNVYCDDVHPDVQLGTRIPEKLKRALKVASLERGVTISDLVCDALCAELGLDGSMLLESSDASPREGSDHEDCRDSY